MELWGGVECTVNRIGDRYRDQIRLTGHHDRIDDLDAVAALGVRRLRYPVLWERVAPDAPDTCDWSWSDQRLERIRALGMAPILGLLHHGSGPRYTSLIDDNFAKQFARYAGAVAERYPWVEDWTPINEPLTTARFSALYGHWYPHARDERLFWMALLNQIDAIRGAMMAIRAVNPMARLIQTDDLGETFSTPSLSGIATYLNQRRWLSWDLLCGRVDERHAMWNEIARYGFGDRLRAICDDPCRPDIIGINYYLTSDRFLDDRPDAHTGPLPEVGYHDICAARILTPGPDGPGPALRACWKRYGIPVALTESHLGCTRDEQLRWLWQSWRQCGVLATEGVAVVGFAPWALFGSVDWSSLLTRDDGQYEPGAFYVRGGKPRVTALADMIRALSGDTSRSAHWHNHPVVAQAGWWQRPARLEHPTFAEPRAVPALPHSDGRPVLITGATGTLGQAFARACDQRGLTYQLTDRATLPIHDAVAVEQLLSEHRPWCVINAAGWVRVDEAEAHVADCNRANRDGPAVLAEACQAHGAHFTTFSSDLVFGGEKSNYVESDCRRPLNVYGKSKADAEHRVGAANPAALIIRTAAFFSPHDRQNFAVAVERQLRRGEQFQASSRHCVTPTYVPHLVSATLDLIIDAESGLWNLTSGEGTSWFDFAIRIARLLDLNTDLVVAVDEAELGWIARRPVSACLATERAALLPALERALAEHCDIRRAAAETTGGSQQERTFATASQWEITAT